MPLDPTAQYILEVIARQRQPAMAQQSPAEAREFRRQRAASIPPGPEASVEERALPKEAGELPMRLYRPLGTELQRLPLVVYFHGGGFVTGDLIQADGDCRRLALGAGCAIASVDYPLAPEHKFPAAPEACFRAMRWLHAHAHELDSDPDRLAVAGDSAGGNLAAVVAIMARDRGGPPLSAQVLYYPITDLSHFDTLSYRENGEAYFLTRDSMLWFARHYLRDEADARNPLASPLLCPDLSRLPPALVITAEYDPLRDEGEAYAKQLERAGSRARLSRYDGMIHGFVTMSSYLQGGARATEEAARMLRSAFDQA